MDIHIRTLYSIPFGCFTILWSQCCYSPFFMKTRTLRKLNNFKTQLFFFLFLCSCSPYNLFQNTWLISYETCSWRQFYPPLGPEFLGIEKKVYILFMEIMKKTKYGNTIQRGLLIMKKYIQYQWLMKLIKRTNCKLCYVTKYCQYVLYIQVNLYI